MAQLASDGAFFYVVRPGDQASAETAYYVYDASSGKFIASTDVNADVSTISLTTQAAVPEPSTCAMLMLGLGALGFLARRRRHVRTFA